MPIKFNDCQLSFYRGEVIEERVGGGECARVDDGRPKRMKEIVNDEDEGNLRSNSTNLAST